MIAPYALGAMNGWVEAWGQCLWRASWQGGLYILAVWAICKCLPRIPASARGWLWWLAGIKLLLGLLPLSPMSLAVLPHPLLLPLGLSQSAGSVSPSEGTMGRQGLELSRSEPASLAMDSSTPVPPLSPLWIAFGAWGIGVIVHLWRIGRFSKAVRRSVARSTPIDDANLLQCLESMGRNLRLRRIPTLSLSEDVAGPGVAGLFNPVILLPPRIDERFTPEELQMALAHELAHLRRRDLWMSLVPTFVQALFFFHPLAWLAGREWKLSAEAACDAEALRLTGGLPADYGNLLLKLISAIRPTQSIATLGVNGDFRLMDGRLKMLRHFTPRRRWAMGLTFLLVLGAACLAPWRVVARGEMDTPEIDPEAKALLEQMDAAYKNLSSFSVEMNSTVTNMPIPNVRARIRFEKPDHSRLEIHTSTSDLTAVSDGSVTTLFDTRKPKEYKQKAVAFDLKKLIGFVFTPGEGDSAGMTSALALFAGAPLFEDQTMSLRMGPEFTLDGVRVQSVVGLQKMKNVPETRFTFTLGKDDHLLRRIEMEMTDGKSRYVETLRNLKINPNLPDSAFAFVPPPGAKPVLVETKRIGVGGLPEKPQPPLQPVNGVFNAEFHRPPLHIVAGRVLTPDGKGVEGVSVYWTTYQRNGFEYVILGSATTGGGGRFRFPHPEQLTEDYRQATLMVAAVGWGITFEDVTEDNDQVRITLRPATTLKVVFHDIQGRPLPNVRAQAHAIARSTKKPPGDQDRWVIHTRMFRVPDAWLDRYACTTDATGSCVIPGLPMGHKISFVLPAAPYAQMSLENDMVELTQSPMTVGRPFVLTPEAIIRGRLTYGPSGEPVAGVKIYADERRGDRGGMGETDRNGAFEIRQLSPGTYSVRAMLTETPMEKEWTSRSLEGVQVAQGARSEGHQLQLIPGAVITGKITASTGEPIAGLFMGASQASGTASGSWYGRTGPDGVYSIRVPGGDIRLTVNQQLPGFKPLHEGEEYQTNEDYLREFRIRDGETKTVDMALPRN